jgi:hypothetical protein
MKCISSCYNSIILHSTSHIIARTRVIPRSLANMVLDLTQYPKERSGIKQSNRERESVLHSGRVLVIR